MQAKCHSIFLHLLFLLHPYIPILEPLQRGGRGGFPTLPGVILFVPLQRALPFMYPRFQSKVVIQCDFPLVYVTVGKWPNQKKANFLQQFGRRLIRVKHIYNFLLFQIGRASCRERVFRAV